MVLPVKKVRRHNKRSIKLHRGYILAEQNRRPDRQRAERTDRGELT